MATILVNGREYFVEMEDMEEKAKLLDPDKLSKFTHFIEMNNKIFPIRQLLAEALAIPPEAIKPLDAYRALKQLGCLPQFCRNDRHE